MKSARLLSVSMVEPADPPGRRSRLAPAGGTSAGSPPTRCLPQFPSRQHRWWWCTLNAQRHAAAGGCHAAGVEGIGDRRELPSSLATRRWAPGWHLGSSEAPGLPTAHRRPAGRDVDELESLEGQWRRRWVVELDQLVARARAAGHHLADDEVIDGRRGRPIDRSEREERGRKQADDDDADGRRSAARPAAGGWAMDTADTSRTEAQAVAGCWTDAYRTLSGRLP